MGCDLAFHWNDFTVYTKSKSLCSPRETNIMLMEITSQWKKKSWAGSVLSAGSYSSLVREQDLHTGPQTAQEARRNPLSGVLHSLLPPASSLSQHVWGGPPEAIAHDCIPGGSTSYSCLGTRPHNSPCGLSSVHTYHVGLRGGHFHQHPGT